MASKYIKMSLDDLIVEHKRLVSTLKTCSNKKAKKELEDQEGELASYVKQRKMAKQEHLEIASDGKREIVPGKEPLKKDPNIKTKSRWNELKKAINNAESILSIEDMKNGHDIKMDQEDGRATEDGVEAQPEAAPNSSDEASGTQAGADVDGAGSLPEQEQPDDQLPQVDESQADMSPDEANDLIVQALKDDGYSDPEIAYIVHGHSIPDQDESGAAKAQATKEGAAHDIAMNQRESDIDHAHKMRMADVEYQEAQAGLGMNDIDKEHAKKMKELEYKEAESRVGIGALDKEYAKKIKDLELDHKKRLMDTEFEASRNKIPDNSAEQEHKKKMMDLEYEQAKQEQKLELEFKKRELELKLRLSEEAHEHKLDEQKEKFKQRAIEAKKNSRIKKSEEE